MSANWYVSFETREQDKNPNPKNIFVALLVGEGGIGHSWRLCVCGWGLCGRGHRVRWGAGWQSPMGSPSMLSLHQGESIHAVPAPWWVQPCWPRNPISVDKKKQALSPPCPHPYVRQPCSASSRSWTGHPLSRVSLPIPISQALQEADF